MAKHCEHCNRPYPDDLESCPHCAAPVEAVEEEAILLEEEPKPSDSSKAILLDEEPAAGEHPFAFDEHRPDTPGAHGPGAEEDLVEVVDEPAPAGGHAPPASGHGELPPFEEEVVELADVHVLGEDSGVRPGAEAEKPAEAAPPGEDSAVDLVHPVDPLGSDSGRQPAGEQQAAPASGTSDSWARLVEEEAAVPAAGEPAADAPSDVALAKGPFAEEVSDVNLSPGPGPELSDVNLAPRPREELSDVHLARGPAEEPSGVSDVRLAEERATPQEVPPAGAAEGPDVDAVGAEELPAAGHSGSGSAIDFGAPGGHPQGSGSDLNFVPEAMESGTSGLSTGEGSSVIDLGEAGPEPGSPSGSAIDLTEAELTPEEPSAIDLTEADEAAGSSSAINLAAEEAAPASSTSGLEFAELESAEEDVVEPVEEKPAEAAAHDETLAYEHPRPPGEEAAHAEEPAAVEGMEEALASGEGPPSARDIVEEVESGVGLGAASPPPSGGGEAVNLEPGHRTGEDSAVDLGAPLSRHDEREPAPAASGGRLDSDMLMAAMEEEAGAAAPASGVESVAEEPASGTGAEAVEEEPAAAEEEGEEAAAAAPKPARARGGAVPWVGGWLIGTVLTAVAAAALWFVGLIPERNAAKQPAGRPPAQQAVTQAPTFENAHSRLAGGDYQEALKMFGDLGQGANAEDPKFQADRGEALWLSALQQFAKGDKPFSKEELSKVPEVGQAKDALTKAANANNPDALFWLGEIQEVMDGPDAARATFEKGMTQFPNQKRRFQAALDSLDINTPAPGEAGARLAPAGGSGAEAYWRAVALIALQAPPQGGANQTPPGGAAQPPPADESEEEEAGSYFWAAERLAQNNDYGEAIKALEKAQKLHERRRFARLRKAQNPLSDPTEQIFLRATDELRVFWQVREKLEDAGLLAKGKRVSPPEILKSVETLTGGQKGLAALAAKLKEEKYDTTDLAKAVDQLFEDKNKAEMAKKAVDKQVAETLAALKAAGAKEADDPVKGVQSLEESKKDVEKKVADTLSALKAAGVKDPEDPVKAVESLDKSKKAAEKKVADVLAALKKAGVKDADDPVKGVEEVVRARDAADTTLDDARKKLVDRKYLPSSAKGPDVPKGVDRVLQDVDHPLAVAFAHLAGELGGLGGKVGNELTKDLNTERRLTASQMEVVRLDAMLGERWSPEQMMDVWLTLLRNPANKDLSARALQDVQKVLAREKMPAAVCVKGLAERDQGKYDEARKDLKSIENAPGDPDGPWRRVVRDTLSELTDPAAHYVPRIHALAEEGRWDDALATADEAVKVFPKEGFPKENAALLALRSLVRLQTARGGKAADSVLQKSRQDAIDALAGGDKVEGTYAQGYLAEAEGDLPNAEKLYREAVMEYEAAGQGAGFRKDHPASDPTGNRYRAALTRVLLAEVRRARPTAAPEPPTEQPKPEGAKTGRRDAAGETSADTAVTTVDAPSKLVAWAGAFPPACALPLVLMQPVAMAEEEAPDPRLQEALDQADRLITAGDARGYLLRGEALCRMGRWNEGRKALIEGVRRSLPADEATRIDFMLENHPAFQKREGVKAPDPVLAEEYYAAGLREYFDRRYVPAERNFSDAVYYNDQDARYQYFLGLAQLAQPGKRDLAVENFRQAGRLEQQGKPSSAAVSVALERVQGAPRELLNGVREQAIREFTSKQP
jgi:tetratricopeptide (TPR) repeat protein